jgi:hypothetical protein
MLCGGGEAVRDFIVALLRFNVCHNSEVVANVSLTTAEECIPVEILTNLAADKMSG